MKKSINLDLIRIFAALMELSVHIGQIVGYNLGVGARGVQLFFVLSGYLAYASLDMDSDVKRYYKKELGGSFQPTGYA